MATIKPRPRRYWLWFLMLTLPIAGGVAWYRSRGPVPKVVQTGKLKRTNLTAIVSASGEIKPLRWVNVGATAYGQITKIFVKEGDRVEKGKLLAQLEAVQPTADVEAQAAALAVAEAETRAAKATAAAAHNAPRTAQADLEKSQAELEKSRLEYSRAENLFRDRLVSRSDLDAARIGLRVAEAAVARATAMVDQTVSQELQSVAQAESASTRVGQVRANLTRLTNVLTKHTFISPLDGLVTNLPVHVGETMVMGVQNTQGSLLMTIADMSVITAEVKVDETEIVNVKLGQTAEVTIDAYPSRMFHGSVTEIGNTAILRTTGQATSLSSSASQEAKDFKVVVILSDPPANLRPGFSTTARIRTSEKKGIIAAPIQALVVRAKSKLAPSTASTSVTTETTGAFASVASGRATTDPDITGLFRIESGTACFIPLKTGIAGTTDIEVTGDLHEGDEVITGSYKILRTLKDRSLIKVDNEIVESAAGETN